MERYLDENLSPAERARALLSGMSIEEKMGQTVGYFPVKPGEYDQLEKEYPHGAGQVSCLEMRRLETLEQAVQMQRDIQRKIMDLSEHHIPAIFHMEGICGAYLPGAVSFPSGIARGCSWDPENEEKIGRIVGRQERIAGITQTLAPVLDISRDSRMGRQGETYGEDPTLAAAMGARFVKGLQKNEGDGIKTHSVAKHFLGFHAASGGIHGTDCDISDRQLREIYAKPFQAAITLAGLKGVMPCYNSINGEPVHMSKKLLRKLLRDEMGFKGALVSDYCAIMNIHGVQKVGESFADAGLKAMEAGMDYEVHFKKCYDTELMEVFKSGQADMRILDEVVERILTMKFEMGLFENPFAPHEKDLPVQLSSEEDRSVSLESAKKSLVLLKNNGVLPLDKKIKKIALIGPHVNTARAFFGGYTHYSMVEGLQATVQTMAGLTTSKDADVSQIETIPGTLIQKSEEPIYEKILERQNPDAKTLLEQLRLSMPDTEISYSYGYPAAGNDMTGHTEALVRAGEADVVIMTAGGKYGTSAIASMGEGIDSTNINLPECQEVFIEKLAKLGKPFVIVHLDGRPMTSNGADKYADAILEAWSPAEFGAQAITQALTGEFSPGGKLCLSVPYTSGQIPVHYNHPNGSGFHQGESIGFATYVDMPHKPRYSFGFGLSYTEFEYSNLSVDKIDVSPDETVDISFTLKNKGQIGGDEIVQLYIKDRYASLTRSVMELAGFRRVHLEAEERIRITFELSASQLAFVDNELKWKIEAGDFDVLIGASSEDIRLASSFRITEDKYIDGKNRTFFAISK